MAVVACLLGTSGGLAGAVSGDVAHQAAVVALDVAGVAVTGKVVDSTALVASGTSTTSWGRRGWGRSAVTGNVAVLLALVALNRAVWTVAFDVTGLATDVTCLLSSSVWLLALAQVVSWLVAVVAQSFCLGAVVGNVTGLSALKTSSSVHYG